MNLVWKLLKQNISKGQFFGFFVANLIGLSIVLLGLQFYSDINPLFSQQDSVLKRDFIVLTKKVNVLSTINPRMAGFSPAEIERIRNTSFATRVGAFTASNFRVYGGVNIDRMGLRTEMFFESLPNYFIDVKTDNWTFSPDEDFIPIILPRNYLDLYNFGFAEARSMPKISEGIMGLINIDLTLSGNYERRNFKGKIVGFSNRINTILVPEVFMNWANDKFGDGARSNPSRLMVEINNPADPNIAAFISQHNYQVEGESDAMSRMSYFLKIIVGIVIVIGLIICALSFFVLTLSIYLLLEKNMEKLQNLRLIGYAKRAVVRPYEILSLAMNAVVLLLSVVIIVLLRSKYCEVVRMVWTDFEPASILPTIIGGALIFILLSCLNIIVIRRKVL